MRLDKTVALVTGGAKRIGRAITKSLVEAGCHVAIHYRQSKAEAGDLAAWAKTQGRRALTVQGDLADPSDWPQIIQQTIDGLGRLDILVNNASEFLTGKPDTIEAFDPALWDRFLRINLTSVAGLCHHARRYLDSHGTGKIVNLCDIHADCPYPDRLAYCVSKAGLAALTRGLARALAPSIQVNGVAPGIAVFPDEYTLEQRERLIAKVPLRRAGTPEDVAAAVRYLVESGDYVTGEIIRVDGGRSIV